MFGYTAQLLSFFEVIQNNFTCKRLTAAFNFFTVVAFANVYQRFADTVTTCTPKSEVIHMRLVLHTPADIQTTTTNSNNRS